MFEDWTLMDFWSWELPMLEGRGVTAGRLLIAMAVFLLVLLLASVIRRILVRRLLPGEKKKEFKSPAWRQAVTVLVHATKRNLVVLFAAVLAAKTLPLKGSPAAVVQGLIALVLWVQLGLWLSDFLTRMLRESRIQRAEEDPSSVSAFGLVSFFAKIAIWSIVLLSVLHSLGFKITGLVAGLGVGGIAVAFALQNILSDIFNSVAIVADKPFQVGDFVIIGDLMGTVEQIGIKTTRLRSLWGEQIVFSNSDLLGSRIRNFKRMQERRVTFTIGVVYQTPADKLERIPVILKEAVEQRDKTRFDRAHFARYGNFSLDFEVVYYVLAPDYNVYMDIQQAINLEIYRRFEAEGVEFAYPTQELILQRKAKG